MQREVRTIRKPTAPKGKTNGRSEEVGALLTAARAVLENRIFTDAAGAILVACKAILDAERGFVAVSPPGTKGLEVVCGDPGGLWPTSAGGLPVPLRRLCARSSRAGRTVIANDPVKGAPQGSPADDHKALKSVLVAPVIIAGDVAALLGVVNKPGGFSAADARLAEVFAEMTAVAMLNSRTANGFERNRHALEDKVTEGATHLREAEEKFRTLVENVPDLIVRFDPDLRHVYASPSVEAVTGRPAREFLGRTNRELGMAPELVETWDAALRRVLATGRPERVEFAFPVPGGTRYFDCRLVPELGPEGAVPSVLSIARDVTDRWLAYEAERRARYVADALREATVALTRSLDRETVLATLLDRMRRLVPFDRARVMVLEEASRVSVRAVFDGDRVIPIPAEKRPEFEATDHPIVYGILTTGTAVMIPDVRVRPDWSLPTDSASEASWMGVPLFARGGVAGLFSLSKREAGYFNEEHVRLAEAMSSQASVAVENAVLFEQMQASTVRMKSLSHRLVEVQEGERRHIARELHDEAGQVLASLRFGLRLLEREISEGESVTRRVAELKEKTDVVIDGLHRLAAGLRPASLDHQGLEAALDQYALSVASEFGLAVHFKARGFTSERLPAVVETALFRVVQEVMTNVVRHARATQVDVLVERRSDRVMVMVEDDGVGFEPDQVPARGSLRSSRAEGAGRGPGRDPDGGERARGRDDNRGGGAECRSAS